MYFRKRVVCLVLAFCFSIGMLPVSADTKDMGVINESNLINEVEELLEAGEPMDESWLEEKKEEENEKEDKEDQEEDQEDEGDKEINHDNPDETGYDHEQEDIESIIQEDLNDIGQVGSWDEYIENSESEIEEIETIDAFEKSGQNMILDMSNGLGAGILGKSGRAMLQSGTTRYTALVLDTSGSMAGTPIRAARDAAIKFVEQVLKADGDNYVSVISFNTKAKVEINFTDDREELISAINKLSAGGSTNQDDALSVADSLFEDNVPPHAIKNIVLLSDGLPETGLSTKTGPYTSSDYAYGYHYANQAYFNAKSLHSKYSIYSLGFFHGLLGKNLDFGRRFMSDLQNAGYYDVVNPDDLDFVFGDIANEIVKKAGRFKYGGQIIQSHDSEAAYYYDDGYFLTSGKDYNPQLATMSLCFQLSTWPSHERDVWGDKTKNVRELLTGGTGVGFEGFKQNEFWNDAPKRNSIGVVAANKKLVDAQDDDKEYTLIALAIRGGGYQSEWASNFKMGREGAHDGFTEARDNVLSFLRGYINEYGITGDVKLWITGYSRAGATANLVGGALADGYYLPNVSLGDDNLFVYSFATPQGGLTSDVTRGDRDYRGIHNIINLNDAVPLVAPYPWGFARYGNDMRLPSAFTSSKFESQRASMLTELYKLEGASTEGYKIRESTDSQNLRVDRSKWLPGGDPLYWWEDSEVSQRTVLVDTVDFLASDVLISRLNYYTNLQNGIEEIFGILNEDDEKVEAFLEQFTARLDKGTLLSFITPMLSLNPKKKFEERINEVGNRVDVFVKDNAKEIAKELKINITDLFVDSLAGLIKDLIVSVAQDVWDNDTTTVNLAIKAIDLIQSGSFGQAHYPEIYLAWMMSRDTNYNFATAPTEPSSGYRVIRINCPVDVQVYDSQGANVASIVNDVSQDVGNSIVAIFNDKGEKLVYLPADEDYRIDIRARDDGELTYSVMEYDLEANGVSRLINYYNIPLAKGDLLGAVAPAFNALEAENGIPNGSTAQYQLFNASEVEILDKEELLGASIADNYFKVTVAANNPSGFVDGSGTFLKGNFAKVAAEPLSGSSFLGWYEGENLVSTDSVYRFAVVKDIQLIAKFEPIEIHELKLTAGAGGKITSVGGHYTVGTEVAVVAEPNPGYKFTKWTTTGGAFDTEGSSTAWFTMPDSDVDVKANFEPIQSIESGSKNTSSGARRDKEDLDDSPKNSDILINGKATNLLLDETGYVTITAEELKNFETPAILSIPFAGGSLTHTAVMIKDEQDTIIPFSVFKNNRMMVLITEPGTYGIKNSKKEFVDIDKHWAAHAINFMSARGVFTGITENKFGPHHEMTRAMFAQVLANIEGEGSHEDATSRFNDVKDGLWYTSAVEWAAMNGLINGYGNELFGPNDLINREQMAVILNNYLEYKGLTPVETDPYNSFEDEEEISLWAREAVANMKRFGIVNGVGNNAYAPQSIANRANVAQILMNFIEMSLK